MRGSTVVPSEVLKLLRLAILALVQRSLLITFLKSCDIYIRFQPPLCFLPCDVSRVIICTRPYSILTLSSSFLTPL